MIHQIGVIQIHVISDGDPNDARQTGWHAWQGQLQNVIECGIQNLKGISFALEMGPRR